MSKATVMGGGSTSELMASWREAVAQSTAASPVSKSLSGKGSPLPTSNTGLVGKWRVAGAAVEAIHNPKKKQREVLKKLLGSEDAQASETAASMLAELGDGDE